MNSPVLDFITVRGFKSIANLEQVSLRHINILIGANGSGKSNFIGLFSFLHAIREGRLQSYIRAAGGAEQILHFGSKITSEINLHISFSDQVNQYKITLKPTEDDSLYPDRELVEYWKKGVYSEPYNELLAAREKGREAGISAANLKGTAEWVRYRLGQWRVYHVHDTSANSPMRKTAQINDNTFLRADGSNLPAFLYRLRSNHSDAYQLIRKSVRAVTPFFDDFLLNPDPLNEESIRLAWKHRESDKYFGASALSDGTLRFIVLATVFLQPIQIRPSVIVVDEPELGLHPYAITILASLVKQAAVQTQVVVATQSSLFLDYFEPDDVLVAERIGGGTQLKRLESSKLDAWLTDYSLGQLWEKNKLGGRPKLGG